MELTNICTSLEMLIVSHVSFTRKHCSVCVSQLIYGFQEVCQLDVVHMIRSPMPSFLPFWYTTSYVTLEVG